MSLPSNIFKILIITVFMVELGGALRLKLLHIGPPRGRPVEHIVCPKNNEVCGYQCFDPATQNCITSESLNTTCAKNESACGGRCYPTDSKEHACHQVNGTQVLCSNEEEVCGFICFNPNTHRCIDDSHVCKSKEGLCAGECYNPTEKVCFGSGVCDIGQAMCGFQCYKPLPTQVCTPDGHLCPVGEESCNGVCYLPSDLTTCFRTVILCHNGSQICGNDCYSPDEGDRCLNDHAVCKTGQELCGMYSCYSPGAGEQCFTEEGSNYGNICKPEESDCKGTCYLNTTHTCFSHQEGLQLTKVICSLGQLNCTAECYSADKDEVCLTNTQGKNVVCKKGQELCGFTCFEPGTKICKKQNNMEALCNEDEEGCGRTCFNPAEQVCLQGVSRFQVKVEEEMTDDDDDVDGTTTTAPAEE